MRAYFSRPDHEYERLCLLVVVTKRRSTCFPSHFHRHHQSEEIYHITTGSGMMELAGNQFAVHAGDTVCINSGTEHRIRNIGGEDLRFIAVSSPPYQHEDTELVGED